MSVLSFEELRNKVKPIADRYSIPEVYLFGSYARGEADEDSDLDFVINYDKSGVTGLEFLTVLHELQEATNKEVDLLDEAELMRDFSLSDKFFKQNFENERKLLYAQSNDK